MLSRNDILLLQGRYQEMRDQFLDLAENVQKNVSAILAQRVIRHMVTFRVKSPESFTKKLTKERDRWTNNDFVQGLSPPLKDLAGVRVLLYLEKDASISVECIEQNYKDLNYKVEKKHHPSLTKQPDEQREDVYKSDHLYVQTLKFNNLICEIQICTLAAHLWNELEHDIIYKQPGGRPDDAQRELLYALHCSLSMATKISSFHPESSDGMRT